MDTIQTENAYYVVEEGQKKGPLNLSALQTMRQQGTLAEDTLIWHDGMGDWQSASSLLPQLFPERGGSAPADLFVATAGQRILVGLIDACILVIPFQIAVAIVGVVTAGLGLLGEFAGPVFNALYGAIIISSWQRTVGMKLLGLKVVDYNGRKPTSGQCWGRALGSIFSWYFLGFGNLLVFFTPRRQTLHDMMAGTLVVKETNGHSAGA